MIGEVLDSSISIISVTNWRISLMLGRYRGSSIEHFAFLDTFKMILIKCLARENNSDSTGNHFVCKPEQLSTMHNSVYRQRALN